MADVTLDRLWLHLASEPDTYLRFFTTGRGDDRTRAGEVRTYAGGRQRIISRASRHRNFVVTLRLVSASDLETLEEWRGSELLLRDHLGTLMVGTFFGLAPREYADRSGYDVALTFQQITSSLPAV